MKKSVGSGLLAGLLCAAFAALGSQESKGICFLPEAKEQEVCIDFAKSWYYAEKRSGKWVVNVRDVNTQAENHVWNGGQYLIPDDEWKKIESGLNSMGLGSSCPPPDFRFTKDYLKTREEICKK